MREAPDKDALSGFVYESAAYYVDTRTATIIANQVATNYDQWLADRGSPVIAEVMKRTHACPGGCGVEVFSEFFACKADWYRLPRDVRMAIWSTSRSDAAAHAEAMADGVRWYAEHPRESKKARVDG